MYIININLHLGKLPEEHILGIFGLHYEWVSKHFALKNFLLSGPYLDKSGAGIIIARHMPRKELNRILADDIYKKCRLASYTVREFEAIDLNPEIVNEKMSLQTSDEPDDDWSDEFWDLKDER